MKTETLKTLYFPQNGKHDPESMEKPPPHMDQFPPFTTVVPESSIRKITKWIKDYNTSVDDDSNLFISLRTEPGPLEPPTFALCGNLRFYADGMEYKPYFQDKVTQCDENYNPVELPAEHVTVTYKYEMYDEILKMLEDSCYLSYKLGYQNKVSEVIFGTFTTSNRDMLARL